MSSTPAPAPLDASAPLDAPAPLDATALEAEVAHLIVESLQLEIEPGEIPPDAPLFGEGLGLDSIDALEIALAISRRYGFQLRSDDERNHQIFASLRNLATHIQKHRVG